MRLGVQTGVYAAWKLFVAEKPASWLVTFANSLVSERPADRLAAFESAWEFVRDELINARRKRSLRVEGAHGLMMVTVVGYVRNMRHWLFPELFPELRTTPRHSPRFPGLPRAPLGSPRLSWTRTTGKKLKSTKNRKIAKSQNPKTGSLIPFRTVLERHRPVGRNSIYLS